MAKYEKGQLVILKRDTQKHKILCVFRKEHEEEQEYRLDHEDVKESQILGLAKEESKEERERKQEELRKQDEAENLQKEKSIRIKNESTLNKYLKDDTINGYYLVTYYPTNRGLKDGISGWILDVKKNNRAIAEAFAIYASKDIEKIINYDYVTRALAHDELEIDIRRKTGLDYFCECLCAMNNKIYRTDLLKKRRTHDKFTTLSRKRRESAHQDNYTCEKIIDKSILIIDDIITTTTTCLSIYNAIIKKNPKANISFFFIGATAEAYEKQVNFDYSAFTRYIIDRTNIRS